MLTEYVTLHLLNNIAVLSVSVRNGIVFVGQTLPPYLVAASMLLVFILRSESAREKLVWMIEALGAAIIARFGIAELIRLFYYRARPFEAHHEIMQLIVARSGNGFPSGHMAFLFAFAVVMWHYHRRTGWCLIAAVALVGVSRIAAGVHYPSDIIGGVVVGMVVGYTMRRLTSKLTSGRFSGTLPQ